MVELTTQQVAGTFIVADGLISLFGTPSNNTPVFMGRVLRVTLGVFLLSV